MTEFKKGDIVKLRQTGGLYIIGDIRSYRVRGYTHNIAYGYMDDVVDVEDIELASDADEERICSIACAQAETDLRNARAAVIAAKARLKALNSGRN